MAEEFQAGICGGTWWNINSTRSVFPLSSSPCSMAANDAGNYSSWQSDSVDLKPTRSCESLVSQNSLGFLDAQKSESTGSILIDSTLQMMDFGLSSSSTSSNWNQSLFSSGRPESNFRSVLQEEAGIDSSNSQLQKEWSPKSSFSPVDGGQVSSTIDAFKPMNQEFTLEQQSLSSVNSTVASQGGFPVGSDSYGFSSKLMQSLYDEPNPHPHPQPQHSLFTDRSMAYNSSSTGNYVTTSNELSPTWSKVSPFLKPSIPKHHHHSGLHFSNNTPFWNASAQALDDIPADAFASTPRAHYQSQTFEEEKPSCLNLITKAKREEDLNSAQVMKISACEPAFKRPRIETPSPLPTFKVRKEKLGDRITALQQLVSPFGKTDTASVLHEAIDYIKFLHDQVGVLSAPYMNNGASIQHHQGSDEIDSEGPSQDLRSRGLCLVPISNTFPVANEITAELWTPSFGGVLMR